MFCVQKLLGPILPQKPHHLTGAYGMHIGKERRNRQKTQRANWLYLTMVADSEELPPLVKALYDDYPTVLMGLMYCLRWH